MLDLPNPPNLEMVSFEHFGSTVVFMRVVTHSLKWLKLNSIYITFQTYETNVFIFVY